MIVVSIINLMNSGAKSMATDGSSVNKTFSYSPSSGSVMVEKLTCLIEDAGTTTFGRFGALGGLTNGVEISVTIGEITSIITTIKDNADLCTRFSTSHFGNGAADTLGGAVGFGDSYDVFIGSITFARPILLTDADSIQVVIKDNLTGLGAFQMACVLQKEVS